jgi:predicted GIY-YIG superfamily endonuclease/antitoxin (DNA-binding transcriptional repressor) of toxin-antitoxin stability system
VTKAPVTRLADRPTALYRCFDAAGGLLYVGITTDIAERCRQHASTSPWWPLVEQRTREWHPNRPDAERAETTAIETERPKYNRAGSATPTNASRDFPPGVEVSQSQLRARVGDFVHATAVRGQITYITRNGRRVAAIVPVPFAEAGEAGEAEQRGEAKPAS